MRTSRNTLRCEVADLKLHREDTPLGLRCRVVLLFGFSA
jgi:hypothetical protein